MIGEDEEAATKEAAKQFVDSFRDFIELRSTRNPGVMLIRPDGYIAYASQSRDGVAGLASVRSVLQRQTDTSSGTEFRGKYN